MYTSGGLIIYICEAYSYKTKNMYPGFDAWEGQFIDVKGGNLRRTLTIGNIYRPHTTTTIMKASVSL